MSLEFTIKVFWLNREVEWQSDWVCSGQDVPITFQPSGLYFSTEPVEDMLKPYIAANNVGNWILTALQDRNAANYGHYLFEREGIALAAAQEYSGIPTRNPEFQPVVIVWEITGTMSLGGVALGGTEPTPIIPTTSSPRPFRPRTPADGEIRKRQQRSNDRWRVERQRPGKPRELLAICQTEAIADKLIALLGNPLITIEDDAGHISVCCPRDLMSDVSFIVVSSDPFALDGETRVEATNEDGELINAGVYSPDIRHPTGATDVDRIVAAFLDHLGPTAD